VRASTTVAGDAGEIARVATADLTIASGTVNSAAVPIYEYQCQGKCKKVFEYMQSMKDPPMKKCEKCGGKLEKQLSASGFVLKGGGWYKDLYASSKPSGGGDSEGASAAASPASSSSEASTKSESKPEPKADKKPAPATKKKSSKGK
jgi:putative FmdB family regulatory protein